MARKEENLDQTYDGILEREKGGTTIKWVMR
jgi:hypothetical protein